MEVFLDDFYVMEKLLKIHRGTPSRISEKGPRAIVRETHGKIPGGVPAKIPGCITGIIFGLLEKLLKEFLWRSWKSFQWDF